MWEIDATATASAASTAESGTFSNSYHFVNSTGGVAESVESGGFSQANGTGYTTATIESHNPNLGYSVTQSATAGPDGWGASTWSRDSYMSDGSTVTQSGLFTEGPPPVTATRTAASTHTLLLATTGTTLGDVLSRSTMATVESVVVSLSGSTFLIGTGTATSSTRYTTHVPTTLTVVSSSFGTQPASTNANGDPYDTVPVSSDQETLTIGSGQSVSAGNNASAQFAGILFGPGEWAWHFTFTDSTFGGVLDLTDAAEPITGTSFAMPPNTTTISTADPDGTYPYTVSLLGLATVESTFALGGGYSYQTATLTGLDPARHAAGGQTLGVTAPTPDMLPLPGTDTFTTLRAVSFSATGTGTGGFPTLHTGFQPVPYSTSAFSDSSGGTHGATTINTTANSGVTATYRVVSTVDVILSVPTILVDGDGHITATTTTNTTSTGFAETTWTYGGSGPLSDSGSGTGALSQSTDSNGTTLIETYFVSSTEEARGATTTTGLATVPVLFASRLAGASVFEPSFQSALRLGSNGKCDALTGPAGTWYYPFFSQERAGLWAAMTYPDARTAAYYLSTYDTALGGRWVGAGTVDSMRYSWDCTAADSSVSISRTRSDHSASTSSTDSTSFILSSASADTATLFTEGGANPFPADGLLVVGGAQWSGLPATAWLGRGIWQATTYDASGGSTTGSFKLESVSTLTVDSDRQIALRPRPHWEVQGSVDADPFRAVTTFDKWQY